MNSKGIYVNVIDSLSRNWRQPYRYKAISLQWPRLFSSDIKSLKTIEIRRSVLLSKMASALCFAPINSFKSPTKPGLVIGPSNARKVLRVNEAFGYSQNIKFRSVEAKAAESNQGTKPNSIVCADCDGNGAVLCSQCKGNGVNSVDHFNGQFKAGGLCWLCRGKREILCGNCNGAGFLGGFMSTFDE